MALIKLFFYTWMLQISLNELKKFENMDSKVYKDKRKSRKCREGKVKWEGNAGKEK